MTQYSNTELKKGEALLAVLLPRAKAEYEKSKLADPLKGNRMEPTSMLGQSLMGHLHRDSIENVVVYERSGGRWYADVILRDMPVGISNVLGTPVAMPLKSEAEAVETAEMLLASVWSAICENENVSRDMPKKDMRVFCVFYEHVFSFDGEMLDALNQSQQAKRNMIDALNRSQQATQNLTDASTEMLYQGLDAALVAIMGGAGFDPEKWQAASEREKSVVLGNMVLLLLLGECHYPPRPDVTLEPSH